MSASLFSPFTLRGLTIRNRIGLSPMCQYSAEDGFISDWHLAHLGARAAGGAGLVMMEATAVLPEGRITPACTGIWKDEHISPLQRLTAFIKSQGAVPAIQLAHAGRKASTSTPWNGNAFLPPAEGGWKTVAPSPLPFAPDMDVPHEMTVEDIAYVAGAFVAAARRAVTAGFEVIEIHGAHGYLLHEFLSPISNQRKDAYGGSIENRSRLIVDIASRMRKAVPDEIVIATRLSCVDWVEGGLDIDDTIDIVDRLKAHGVDLIDCSSGAIVPRAYPEVSPGYQVPFAKAIRKEAGIPTAAVGMITEAAQADAIIRAGDADMIFIGRAFLRDPAWAIHAAKELGVADDLVPRQYARGY